MKKFFLPLLLLVVVFACQMQDETVTLSDDASSQGPPGNGNGNGNSQTYDSCYVNSYSYNADGTQLTLTINGAAACAKDISHLVFKFDGQVTSRDCSAATGPMTVANITGLIINGVDAMESLSGNIGNGDVCNAVVDNPLVKIDPVPNTDIVTIVMTFDTPVTDAFFLIKAGTSCVGYQNPNYDLSRECTPPPMCYNEDTGWAAGTRYVSRGNWATWTPYSSGGSVNIFAGQNKFAGTATFSPVSADGKVTISISLNPTWSLQDVSNPVKIQNYANTPPAGNPSPGRFAFKGSSLTVTVPADSFYGIHLDLRQAVACPQ